MRIHVTPEAMSTTEEQLALDFMLKMLISTQEFNDLPEKNWTAVSKLIPGTNASQCQKRYEELQKDKPKTTNYGMQPLPFSKPSAMTNARTANSEGDNNVTKDGRPPSAKIKGSKSGKDATNVKGSSQINTGDGPLMVIHVCDEAKNLKQDFQCPRDLLVREMRYFAEYLSTDAQRWDEVDISVHCDVQIFDWLMNYVKRSTKDAGAGPSLEPNNVISILISSDFLKMDNLVTECIQFCHKNLSAVVATPCNMNCISDKLVTRLADLFNHNDADDVKDRKDKFKNKLFAKLIEKLFDPSTESAATIYRCTACKRLLTKNIEGKVKCLHNRLSVNSRGKLVYRHMRDMTWDVNAYLLELKGELKTWREIYWRLWGQVNALPCARCGEVFPCAELGHCRHHPDHVVYEDSMAAVSRGAVGEFPCCQLRVLRFDPTQPNKGCKVRDHVVTLAEGDSSDVRQQQVYNDLLAHRDVICVPYEPAETEDPEVDVFGSEDTSVTSPQSAVTSRSSLTSSAVTTEESAKTETRPQGRLQALTVSRELSHETDFGVGESDDEVGDEEDSGKGRKGRGGRRTLITVDPQAILLGAPDFSMTKTGKWDSSRSMRWNQDAQREEDQRRMTEMVNYLTKLRANSEKMERLRQRECAGGVFVRLEAQWKAVHLPTAKPGGAPLRNKPRLSQLVNK